jgi:hypothetical protein
VSATDGSTTITAGGAPQNLFGGVIPANGWFVANPDTAEDLWVSDTTTAAPNGVGSIKVLAGTLFTPPIGRETAGAVSVYGLTTGHKITASRW